MIHAPYHSFWHISQDTEPTSHLPSPLSHPSVAMRILQSPLILTIFHFFNLTNAGLLQWESVWMVSWMQQEWYWQHVCGSMRGRPLPVGTEQCRKTLFYRSPSQPPQIISLHKTTLARRFLHKRLLLLFFSLLNEIKMFMKHQRLRWRSERGIFHLTGNAVAPGHENCGMRNVALSKVGKQHLPDSSSLWLFLWSWCMLSFAYKPVFTFSFIIGTRA